MHLAPLGALAFALAATAACSSDTAPKPPDITGVNRVYALQSVDGVSLPAVAASFLFQSGILTLDSTGGSHTITHFQPAPGDSSLPDQVFDFSTPYRIVADSIFLGSLGHCRDLCVRDRAGLDLDSTVTIPDAPFFTEGHVFHYRRVD
jgi:hypothetical protein